MKYYKQGCCSAAVNSQSRAKVAGITDWPEPLPTIALYFFMLFGAILWVKAGGF